jgi:GDP-L-fucose synthase
MKVLVSGGNSMIGRATIKKLKEKNYDVVGVSRQDCDFLQLDQVRSLFTAHKPDVHISLTSYNGGLSFNAKYPFEIYTQTIATGINSAIACVENNVKKVIYVVPSCALNPSDEISYEEDLYKGEPHHSVRAHGWAKRAVARAFNDFAVEEYGMDVNIVIGQNSMGPYDRFDEDRGKVVSALIRRIVQAKINREESVIVYGSGSPLREFIYCKDFANGIIAVLETPDCPKEINITSGHEISIKELAEEIKLLSGYEGELIFDTTKSDGQMRKKMSSDRMNKYLSFLITDFRISLRETIDWYVSTLEKK